MYRILSGRSGEARDWSRFAELFTTDARLIPLRDTHGASNPQDFSVQEYIHSRSPMLREGDFFEVEIGAETTEFGDVAHVLSAYASSRTPDGPPFSRGVNSVQLVRLGGAWRVACVAWDVERPGLAIPPRLTDH